MSDEYEDHKYEGRVFVPEERRSLRKMLKEWDKFKWLTSLWWKTIAWITATVSGVWIARDEVANAIDAIKEFLKR